MTPRRLSLFALYSNVDRIEYTSGDRINELRLISRLARFFDVYYNNELFLPEKEAVGLEGQLGPVGDYDLYYVRNAPEILSRIRGIRLAFAHPYDAHVFKTSDFLVVLNENWRSHLISRDGRSGAIREDVYGVRMPPVGNKVINVGQSYDEKLRYAESSEKERFYFSARMTRGHAFGFYGNLSRQFFPLKAFWAVQQLWEENQRVDPVLSLAGRFRKGSKIDLPHAIYLGNVPYANMAALYDATCCALTNETPLNHMLGNQKTLDAMSRGVPLLCAKVDTFVYQLGDDYPFFYETEGQAYRKAKDLLYDETVRQEVGESLRERADRLFSPSAATALLRSELKAAGLIDR